MTAPRFSTASASPLDALLHEARYLDDDLMGGRPTLGALRRMTAEWRAEATDRVARDSAPMLARLGGSEPDVEHPSWHR